MGAGEGRAYRGVSAGDRTAARRAALLEAALDLLGGDPPAAATMTAVCERAGLTERYFYESFRSRDELLVALLDQVAGEVLSATVAVLDEEGGADVLVRRGLEALVAVLGGDPRKGRFALVTSLEVPVLRERRAVLLTDFEHLLAERTRRLYGDRAWVAPDDRIEALLFVGGLAELLAAWLAGTVPATREQVVAAAARHYEATAHR
ncbi:TetR/AcrR family transcriptional regulator [Nocardioides marmoribigeumensis]|uniref:AcrR family transcriptional regulator n=1 Tax=Nocardioides marmoribigeumensis TaxID=433649 RepID=A0ABU2BZ67_9ACTN|nr:TetR/AcrR family transcriptional regulator [Nocardioides marmoribigeumensis]MDR7363697.1 AcrR family transcriptional regulator [Nocardioides marmoribigeumensis]